jgi:hypothetical protein
VPPFCPLNTSIGLHRLAAVACSAAAEYVRTLPDSHPLFGRLDAAQAAGGYFWTVRRSDFLYSFGYGPASEGFAYILVEKLESLAVRFVAQLEGEARGSAWT